MYLPLPFLFYALSLSTRLEAIIKTGHFKRHACSQQDVDTIPSKINKVPSAIRCTFLCNRYLECNLAIFNVSDQTCKQAIRPNDPSTQLNTHYENELNYDQCIVFVKQGQNQSEPILKVKVWNNFTFLPHALVTKMDNMYRVNYISHVTHSSQGLIITTKPGNLAVNVSSQTFVSPPSATVLMLVQNSQKQCFMYSYKVDLKGELTEDKKEPCSLELIKTDYLDQTEKPKDVIIADSVEKVLSALSKGYKRVETHPSYSKMLDDDVVFGITDALIIKSMEKIKFPFYVSSIKESLKLGKRYRFQFQMINGSRLESEMENQLSPWIMETSWEKVMLSGDSTNRCKLLGNILLQGRDLRMVIGNKVSADLLFHRINDDNIVSDLAHYLSPFQKFIIDENDMKVRFSVLSFGSKTLLSCTKSVQTGTVVRIHHGPSGPVSWFVSTKNWTKIFSMKSDMEVIEGNHDHLRNAVIQGRGIRVCLIGKSSRCFGAAEIFISDSGDIILQSPASMTTKTISGVKSLTDKCERRVYLVSTGGKIRVTESVHRTEIHSAVNDFRYDRQDWFVQFD